MKRTLLLAAVLLFLPLCSCDGDPPGKPQIIADAKTNTVRILIDGKEVVRIDAAGLHVTGDVTYTGTESDRGTNETEPRK